MFIGFCKQGLCILLPFTRPHHLLLTAGIDSKYTSRQHYICIILLVEFSKNLLHAIRPQAHKDPLRRLENWLYSRNNTTELSKQLPPSLGGGLESRSVKFCFLDFLNCPSKAFDALTIIILESLSLRFVPLTYQTHFNLKPDQHHRMLLFNINNCPCGYSLGETINLTLVFFTESSNFTNIRRIAVCFVDIAFPTCWLREPTIFRRVSYWSANTETSNSVTYLILYALQATQFLNYRILLDRALAGRSRSTAFARGSLCFFFLLKASQCTVC